MQQERSQSQTLTFSVFKCAVSFFIYLDDDNCAEEFPVQA